MQTFRDNAGRTWPVVINVAAVKRVRAALGLDLFALVEDGFAGLGKLLGDPVMLVDVLYVLCESEATARGVSDEDFGGAMGGDSLESAAIAFSQEYADFFPNPQRRAAMKKLLATSDTLGKKLMDRAEAELDSLDDPDALDRLLDRFIASSGGSRASSASTPGPSR